MSHFTPRKMTVTIEPISRFSWSRAIDDCPPKKSHAEWDLENWKNKAHIQNGEVAIPTMSLKLALIEAARYDGRKLKGNSTYTKLMERAIIPQSEYTTTGVKESKLVMSKVFVPSDGRVGGSTRVHRHFPVLEPKKKWAASFDFLVIDDRLTKDILFDFLTLTGMLVGLGRWRPEKRGPYGRFTVKEFKID